MLLLSCLVGVNSVSFGQAPPNDNFANATVIHGNEVTFGGTLSNATFEAGELEGPCYNFTKPSQGGSVWWSWTATNTTSVIVEILVPNSKEYGWAAVSVLNGSSLAGLTPLDCTYFSPHAKRYVVFAATAGTTYRIRVGRLPNCCDSLVTPVALRLTATDRPLVLQAPISRANEVLSSAEFHVIAAGAGNLSYQWYFADQPITGETNPIVIWHRLQASQAGAYSVVVSNSGGAVTSAVATLTMLPRATPPRLEILGVTNSRIAVALVGETVGRYYLIESSTNLLDWTFEESLHFFGADAILQSDLLTEFTIPLGPKHKFWRAIPDLEFETCVTQLEGIRVAIQLFAIETRAIADATVTEDDLEPYFTKPPACPSSRPFEADFEDSYSLTDVSDRAKCEITGYHLLPH